MSGPGPSTSGMSRPGPSSHVIHPNTSDTYISGRKFSYFAGSADCSDDSEEENNNIDNDSLPVDKVALDHQIEGDDDDRHDFSESDDDMVNSDDNHG